MLQSKERFPKIPKSSFHMLLHQWVRFSLNCEFLSLHENPSTHSPSNSHCSSSHIGRAGRWFSELRDAGVQLDGSDVSLTLSSINCEPFYPLLDSRRAVFIFLTSIEAHLLFKMDEYAVIGRAVILGEDMAGYLLFLTWSWD